MTDPSVSRRSALRAVLGLVGLGLGTAVGRVFLRTEPTIPTNPPLALEPPATRVTAGSTTPPITVQPTTTSSTSSTTTTPLRPEIEIRIVAKADWDAMDVAGEFQTHTLERMTVHHTAVLIDDPTLGPDRARQHQKFHIERGWPDLAYHYLVDPLGIIYEGRPVDTVGDTGTSYDPTGHFLVCCEGNFDEQDPTSAQLQAATWLLAWAAVEFSLDPSAITGHRDWAETSCPGDALYAAISTGSLETQVKSLIDDQTFKLNLSQGA